MENIVFERNYEKPKDGSDHCTAIFDQAVEGGFFQRYCDMMNKVPKIIVPQDKENYEYLLNRCNQYAEQHYGRIRGVVSYERWDSTIDLYLPMLEFDDEEDMSLLRDIGEKAHYVNVSHQPDGGFCLHIMINYFEELASDMEKITSSMRLSSKMKSWPPCFRCRSFHRRPMRFVSTSRSCWIASTMKRA